jgi:uncharacterized protein YjbI with pentapeptide repeats
MAHVAVFFGAAVFGAVFFGAVFFGAVFFGAAFLGAPFVFIGAGARGEEKDLQGDSGEGDSQNGSELHSRLLIGLHSNVEDLRTIPAGP